MSNSSTTSLTSSGDSLAARRAHALIRGTKFYCVYVSIVFVWIMVLAAYSAVQFFDQRLSYICGDDGRIARAAFAALALLACLATFLFAFVCRMTPGKHREELQRLCQSSEDMASVVQETRKSTTSSTAMAVLCMAVLLSVTALAVYPVLFKVVGLATSNNIYLQMGEMTFLTSSIMLLLALVFVMLETDRATSLASELEKAPFQDGSPSSAMDGPQFEHHSGSQERSSC